MQKHPLVAIVVLNYNGAKCLPIALRSLVDSDYAEKEIIVVDNGSADDSLLVARNNFPQVRYIENKKNVGFAAGMNVGIREAMAIGAKFVWLFNDDAKAAPGALTELVRFCESRSDVGAVSPQILATDGEIWFSSGKISFLRMRAYHVTNRERGPHESEYLSGCALFLPISALHTVGLLDERYFLYYEDVDLSRRLVKAGRRLFVLPSACVVHGERSETDNPRKIYFLVYSALLFFHQHAPAHLRPWLFVYERLRRLKNIIDGVLHRKNAEEVHLAYADFTEYDRKNR